MENQELQEIPVSTEISELNAFELTIQEHEKELNFVPDMSTKESRSASDVALKAARKTYKLVDGVRLEKKKEAEQRANAIHEQGKKALSRLEAGYTPHKNALDIFKAEQKRIEEELKQSFYDACQWLNDVVGVCQFATVEGINAFIAEVTAKDQDNTGLEFNKDQKFEYGKIRLGVLPKLDQALQQRIIKDAEDARQQQAALELAQKEEDMRKQQEAFEAQQQKQREADAARQAKEQAEREAAAREEQLKKQAEIDKENARIAEEARQKQAAIDAENNRIAEEQRLKQAKIDAAEREKERIEAEQAEAKRIADAKSANVEHRRAINACSVVELMNCGITEDQAVNIVKKLATGHFAHLSINY